MDLRGVDPELRSKIIQEYLRHDLEIKKQESQNSNDMLKLLYLELQSFEQSSRVAARDFAAQAIRVAFLLNGGAIFLIVSFLSALLVRKSEYLPFVPFDSIFLSLKYFAINLCLIFLSLAMVYLGFERQVNRTASGLKLHRLMSEKKHDEIREGFGGNRFGEPNTMLRDLLYTIAFFACVTAMSIFCWQCLKLTRALYEFGVNIRPIQV